MKYVKGAKKKEPVILKKYLRRIPIIGIKGGAVHWHIFASPELHMVGQRNKWQDGYFDVYLNEKLVYDYIT